MRWHRLACGLALVVATGCNSAAASVAPTFDRCTVPASVATYLVRTVGQTSGRVGLQLRDVRNGRVVCTVAPPTMPTLTAAVLDDGRLLVGFDTSPCSSEVDRVDPATAKRTRLFTLDRAIGDVAAAPDGRTVAVTTQLDCRDLPSMSGSVAGPAGYLPSRLVVVDVVSGRRRVTATDEPGHPLQAMSFSPDGRRLAVDYFGDADQIRILSLDRPDFGTSTVLPSVAGCGYVGVAWVRTGILAARGCGPVPALEPDRIVDLDLSGHVVHRWPLPACVNGVTLAADSATHTATLAEMNLGYGGCGGQMWAQRTVELEGSGLRTVSEIPGNTEESELLGW